MRMKGIAIVPGLVLVLVLVSVVFSGSLLYAAGGVIIDHHGCDPADLHQAEAYPGLECVNFTPGSGIHGIPGSMCWTDPPRSFNVQMFCTESYCSLGGTLGCVGGGQSFSLFCPAVNGNLPMVEAQKGEATCFNAVGNSLAVECGNNGQAFYSWY